MIVVTKIITSTEFNTFLYPLMCKLKKLQSNVIEIITLRHGCSSVNLLRIFRRPFPKNTFGRVLLKLVYRALLLLITSTKFITFKLFHLTL